MKKRFALAILMLSLAVPSAFASDALEVSLGHSQVIGPVKEMATVIIGNNGVADATLGGGGTIILTGKTLGVTNLIVLDEMGRELLASPLHVVPLDRRPTTTVRVSKGVSMSQNYVCGPTSGCLPAGGHAVASIAPVTDDVQQDAAPESLETTPETTPRTPETENAPAAEEQVSLNP